MQYEPKAESFNEDCIAGMSERLADDSIDLTVTSIPFESIFSYSGKVEDVGNSPSTVDMRSGRFALNLRFWCDQLYRVHSPGTNVCLHVQTLIATKNQFGFMGRRDFRGAMIDVFGAAGFNWIGEVAIPKDPQQAAQRSNRHSLQFKTGKSRTATNLSPNVNDYVLIFQKPGEVSHPVRCIYDAKDNPGGWITTEDWVRWANGSWHDILQVDILDGWKSARESDEERHVCPLQLSLIYRLVMLYTNPICVQPDVTVLDPFAGIFSTGYVCLGGEAHDGRLRVEDGHGRNFIGFELKESYHDLGVRNLAKARELVVAQQREPDAVLAFAQGEP